MRQRPDPRVELTESQRDQIRACLGERRLTQAALAVRLGISDSRVRNLLRRAGKSSPPLIWLRSEIDALRGLLGKAPPWPLEEETAASVLSPGTAAIQRINLYFGAHRTLAYGTKLAVEELIARPENWPDSVLLAFCRAVEPPSSPRKTPPPVGPRPPRPTT